MIRKIDEENTKSEKFVYFQRFDEVFPQFQIFPLTVSMGYFWLESPKCQLFNLTKKTFF